MPTKTSTGKSKPATWWKLLDDEQRAEYIALHPKSKYAKQVRQAHQDELKADPKKRRLLRAVSKRASKSKKLKDHIDKKLDPESFDKTLTPSEKKALDKHMDSAMGNVDYKSLRKAVGLTLKIAGLATVGGALFAFGGLPYVLLTASLVRDMKSVYTEVKSQVEEGVDTTKALVGSLKKVVTKNLEDPDLIQTALISQNHSKAKRRRFPGKNSKDTN